MKLILDVDSPADYSEALVAVLEQMRRDPNQKVGSVVLVAGRNKTYAVIRNQLSYTVKGER